MSYARTYTIDASPTGDTVKAAVVDKIDPDLTSIYTNLNTHEGLTATHGATGAIVGTTNVQALTNKTLTSSILTGTTTCSSLKLTDGTFTGTITATGATLVGFADFNNSTFTGTTTIATANIAAGTFTGTLTAGTLGSTTTTNAGTITGGTLSTATLTACTISASCTVGGTLSSPVINGAITGTAFTNSTAASGYTKLGNGMILQWGTTGSTTTVDTITFPLAFPNGALSITATPVNGDTQNNGFINTIGTSSVTSFILYFSIGEGGGATFASKWMAIGY